MFVDHYAVLGLSFNSTKEELKSAYRALAKKWHPDLNSDFNTTSQMQQVIASYTILNDDEAKERYDIEYKLFKDTLPQEIQFKTNRNQTNESNKDNSKSNSDEEVFEKYQYDYEPNDPILKEWMDRANQQARDFVANMVTEAKGVAKDAAVGFGQGLISTIIVIVIINIIFLMVRGCS